MHLIAGKYDISATDFKYSRMHFLVFHSMQCWECMDGINHDLKLYYFSMIYLDQDECELDSLNDCDDNATCTNTIGGYNCTCDVVNMFFGDGFTCISKIAWC